jgi:hypothetical protein
VNSRGTPPIILRAIYDTITVSITVGEEEEEEEEEEFFNHYKNDQERHAHTPSGVAGARF